MLNNESELAQKLWADEKPPCPIIDFHAHMHDYAACAFPASQPEQMVHTMERCGTRLTLFCSHLAMYDPDEGEKYQMQAVRRFPDRLKAYHGVISRHTDPERAIRDIEDNPDVYVGFKFLCDYNGVKITDDIHKPYLEYLNERKLLMLAHTWGESEYSGERLMAKIAEKYPDITIICGHSFWGTFDHAFELLGEYPNVWFELTAVPLMRGFIEDIAQKAGSDRMLFGTDLPWFATLQGVGALCSAELTDAQRKDILYKNGDKILRRFSWYKGIDNSGEM